MPLKLIRLENSLTVDDLPDNGNVNHYLSLVISQILSLAAGIKEKKKILNGIGVKVDFSINYFLHQDKDYKNLSLTYIFNYFYKICGVSNIFDFVNWLNDAVGESIEESVIIDILNNKIEFTEEIAKLIIKRIEEHVKIKTALKRALYSHTSMGVKKGFKDDEFTGVIKINDYDKDSAYLILEFKKITNKILHAVESLKYQSLSFRFVTKFRYKI